jgi:hypothetical protein
MAFPLCFKICRLNGPSKQEEPEVSRTRKLPVDGDAEIHIHKYR